MAGPFGTRAGAAGGAADARQHSGDGFEVGAHASLLRRWFKPSIVVGTLSLLAVVLFYWYLATRPGTNPALVPPPPQILQTFGSLLSYSNLLPHIGHVFSHLHSQLHHLQRFE